MKGFVRLLCGVFIQKKKKRKRDYFVESLKKIMQNKNAGGIILISMSNLFVLRVQWNRKIEEVDGLMIAFFEALVIAFRVHKWCWECFFIVLPASPSLLT